MKALNRCSSPLQGIGLDVLAAILRRVTPTHVVTLATGIANKDLPNGEFWSLQQPGVELFKDTVQAPPQPACVCISLRGLPTWEMILQGPADAPSENPGAEQPTYAWNC